jgi:hypothetical protein
MPAVALSTALCDNEITNNARVREGAERSDSDAEMPV